MRLDLRRFAAGVADTLPFTPSVAILAAIFGASAAPAGVSPPAAVLMSLLVYSGTAQFAALPIWHERGLVIALSTLVLSLRFALMTTSVAPRLARYPAWVRAMVGFGITDETYALAVSRRGGEMEPGYLVGSWLTLYVPWTVGTAAGVLAGAQFPAAWMGPLNAVFPIVFLTLTVLVCTSAAAAAVAVLGGLLAVIAKAYLPNGWHVVAAGLLASLAGPLLERAMGKEGTP